MVRSGVGHVPRAEEAVETDLRAFWVLSPGGSSHWPTPPQSGSFPQGPAKLRSCQQ